MQTRRARCRLSCRWEQAADPGDIPYPYLRQLDAFARLRLADEWLREVCYHNAARLLGL
jgi:uncharacterized protein